ncbi:GntR family transcriptional regulator [Alcanivorax balearicus MACL04]|uniref:GntR family transcriptional regulator n=1 Tax=Alloalcanivorax balearicus MACL04 TaxID=1177182 RepID=A0ABT2QXU7_9GAMM|nr:GntR family transcriptional regulator [Alloalcanivorax balearicus]MCU5782323.1 GntR family transcriptional regulator [Alloalcanivorax balearicus MACL04]
MPKKEDLARLTPAESKPDPHSASMAIVRDVIRGLYEGRYVPGQRLVEPDLVKHYGVGRSTVREALKQLTADGIVVSYAFRGARIRELTRREASNLFAITEVMLGLVARQAAANMDSKEKKERLETHFQAIANHSEGDGHFAFLQHRNRYFRALVDIGENEEILRILPRLQVHLIRNRSILAPAERVRGYRGITRAVLRGDAEKAEKITRHYIARIASSTLPFFPE